MMPSYPQEIDQGIAGDSGGDGNDMEMIQEMAALGLPTTFVARAEVPAGRSKEGNKRKEEPVFSYASETPSPIFRVRSTRLHTDDVAVCSSCHRLVQESVDSTGVFDCQLDETEYIGGDGDSSYELLSGNDFCPSSESMEISGSEPCEETNGGKNWQVVWDNEYQCHFYFNSRTLESTWNPPSDLEHHTRSPVVSQDQNSSILDPNVHSMIQNQMVEKGRCDSAPLIIMQVTKIEEEPLSASEEVFVLADVQYEHGEQNGFHDSEVEVKTQLARNNDSRKEVKGLEPRTSFSDGSGNGKEENEGTLWRPIWDEQYQCYYFFNSGSQEVTWEAPAGFEHYSSSGLVTFEQNGVPGVVSGEKESNLSLTMCSARVIAKQVEVEESTFKHVRIDESPSSVLDQVEVLGEEVEGFGAFPPSQACPLCKQAKLKEDQQGSKLATDKMLWGFTSASCSSLQLESRSNDNVLLPGMAEMMHRTVIKYWRQRYSLFAKYDQGIKMDDEGWFSVTPEIIAKHQASRLGTGLVIDAFTGVGGNAIQFALNSHCVIAIDINPERIEYARHNAKVYGVADKIEFIVGDFFQLAPFLKADVVFLSPPWGGPEYQREEIFDINSLQPKGGRILFQAALAIAPNIAVFLPRNVNLKQVQELSWLSSPPLPCEVENNLVNNHRKARTAYYGDIANC